MMTRHFKILGVAMLAVFALSITVVSAAQAAETITAEASPYPAVVTGAQTNENVLKIGAGVREVTCSVAALEGSLAAPSAQLTITPSYSGCTAKPGSTPATVKTNSCDYLLTAGAETSATEGHASADLSCTAENDGIDVYIYENLSKHAANESLCTYRITPQAISGIKYHNTGSGTAASVDLDVSTGSTIAVMVEAAKSKLLCGGVKGENVAGTFTGKSVWVAENGGVKVGLMVSAETITAEASPYPAVVTGAQTNENVLKIGAGVREVTCSVAALEGSLAAPSAQLTITPSYSGCTAKPGSTPATVKTNSCDYLLTAGAETSATEGHASADLSCTAENDGIDVYIYENLSKHAANESLCTYRITPQAISGIKYHNTGSGTAASVDLDVSTGATIAVMVEAAKSKLLCGGVKGENVAGTFTGKSVWVAENGGRSVGLMVG